MRNNFFLNRKVLVTGHTGFKGTWLSLALLRLGADVYGYALKPDSKPSLYEICGVNDLISSTIGDVRDLPYLKDTLNKIQPEIVFHLAAQPLVGYSYDNPILTYETNVMGTLNLLESIRTCSSVKAIVNITTDKCYENKNQFRPYVEEDSLGGYDPYSSSKACSEILTHSYCQSYFNESDYDNHGVAIATARAGNVIGGGDFTKGRIVPDIMETLLTGKELELRNPRAIRPWQHVLEPISGYLMLAENLLVEGPKYNGPWNFGPNFDNEKNVGYLVSLLSMLWGRQLNPFVNEQVLFHESSILKLDSYKSNLLLNWKPRWSIEETSEKIIEWYKVYMRDVKKSKDITIKQIDAYFGISE